MVMRLLHSFVFTFSWVALFAAGCSCSATCDFPIMCVDHCGGTVVSDRCGPCPSGSVPIRSCNDASLTDAASPDAPTSDASDASATLDTNEAPDADDEDAAAPVCDRPSYPPTSMATRDERTAVETAVAPFTAATGVTVELDASTAAVTGFSAPFPVTLDASITDPCMRALDAVQTFLTDEATMMRVPPDIAMRACSYDSVLDMEVVRLHGGTYAGRRILGQDNDLVVHVTRSGTIRYWGGSYLPVAERLIPQPCFDAAALESSVVGDSLHFLHFTACVPGTTGSKVIADVDTRTAGESSLYVDAAGFVHVARRVEVLLEASRVGTSEIESDLYCCAGTSVAGCVGDYLIVDEITEEILDEMHRCITC
jgi:hypothetical protein